MSRTQARPAVHVDQAMVHAALGRAGADNSINLNDLPEDGADLVRQLLHDYAAGRQPCILTENADVSTFEAASLLNVSHPHLIGLLEKGELPFRSIDTHRRMKLTDLLTYKDAMDRAADAAMDKLVAQAQSLKFVY